MVASLVCALLVGQTSPLWRIGIPDGKGDEFALAPNHYAAYREDPTYLVGLSHATDWPYVLPGPDDSWAGSEAHEDSIFFGLRGRVTGPCRLIVNFLETHAGSPPQLTILVNGKSVTVWQAPHGNGDAAIEGHPEKGRPATWIATIPKNALRQGPNEIGIRNDRGSWVVFDALRLEGPSSLTIVPVPPALRARALGQDQVVLRTPQGPRQQVRLAVTNFGRPGRLEIRGDAKWTGAVKTGVQTIALPTASASTPRTIHLHLQLGRLRQDVAIPLAAVRPWTVYLLPHAHVDVGYTGLQADVLAMHRRNLTDATTVAAESQSLPAEDRYHFTAEASWILDHIAQDGAPDELRRIREAFQSGALDCSAAYCNVLTGLMRPEELARAYGFSDRLRNWLGVPQQTATQTDVPGVTWGAVAALSQAGVHNLVLMPNPADRIGGVLREWQDKPFYWVSPSGRERVFVWETASYGVAHGLRRFNGDRSKIFRTQDPSENFIGGYVLPRLKELADQRYPYDCLALPWSETDNPPIDGDVPEAARRWNATYVTPRVVVTTASGACKAFLDAYGEKVPQVKGDFTPYWEDGAGSSAHETSLNRASADRLVQAETLLAMTHPSAYDPKAFWKAWSDVILYSEHTWGAANSVSEPDAEIVAQEWRTKQNFALEASSTSTTLLDDARFRGGHPWSVVNTTSWPRTDLVVLSPEQSREGDRVLDQDGRPLPSQRLQTSELAVLVKDVPAFGSVGIQVVPGLPHVEARASVDGLKLQSPEWQVTIDPATGGLAELWNIPLGKEFVDHHAAHRMNGFLYLPGADLKGLVAPNNVHVSVVESGPLVARLRVTSQIPGARSLTQDVQVVAGLDRVDLIDAIDKVAVRAKEGVHFAFPFAVPGGQMRIQGPFAVVRPDLDQIPGANKNWFNTQYFADVSNPAFGVTWSSLDAPLMEVGGITANILDGGYDARQWVSHLGPTQTLYSWALNNHWYTNYRADQEGLLTYRYSLRAHGPYAPEAAYRFGAGLAQPLLVSANAPATPLVTVSDPRVVVSSLKPSEDGRAFIVRLWCVGDRPAEVQLHWRKGAVLRTSVCDTGERALHVCPPTIRLAGWEVTTLRAERSQARAGQVR